MLRESDPQKHMQFVKFKLESCSNKYLRQRRQRLFGPTALATISRFIVNVPLTRGKLMFLNCRRTSGPSTERPGQSTVRGGSVTRRSLRCAYLSDRSHAPDPRRPHQKKAAKSATNKNIETDGQFSAPKSTRKLLTPITFYFIHLPDDLSRPRKLKEFQLALTKTTKVIKTSRKTDFISKIIEFRRSKLSVARTDMLRKS